MFFSMQNWKHNFHAGKYCELFIKIFLFYFTALLDEFFLNNEKQNLSSCQAKRKYTPVEFQRKIFQQFHRFQAFFF